MFKAPIFVELGYGSPSKPPEMGKIQISGRERLGIQAEGTDWVKVRRQETIGHTQRRKNRLVQ